MIRGKREEKLTFCDYEIYERICKNKNKNVYKQEYIPKTYKVLSGIKIYKKELEFDWFVVNNTKPEEFVCTYL